MMSRKLVGILATATTTVVIGLGAAPAYADNANSVQPAIAIPVSHKYSLVNHTIAKYWTRKAQLLGSCSAVNVGLTCTIARGKSASRTVQVDFSASRGAITAALGISSAYTVETTVSCSAHINAGQRWGAWPVGSHHKYLVKDTATTSFGATTTNVGTTYKYTFNPYASSISCGLF
jgi:hypothetical protein